MIKVVSIRSISFTGTTWTNLIMASHPDGFYLGPPDRLWNKPAPDALRCLVHRGNCQFIDTFIDRYDQSKRFLPQLRDYVGDKIIYINNPTPAFRSQELTASDIELREMFVLRDCRAVIHSALVHVGDRYPDFQTCLTKWMFPAIRRIYRDYRRNSDHSRFIRYEDMVVDPLATLNSLGDFLGVKYDESALRYWEWPHHPTAGNTGTVDVLARMQGLDGHEHRRRGYYDAVLEQTKQEPSKPKIDLSWVGKMTPEDRLAYDTAIGAFHEFFGYERDKFTDAEREAFAQAHDYWQLKGYPVVLNVTSPI